MEEDIAIQVTGWRIDDTTYFAAGHPLSAEARARSLHLWRVLHPGSAHEASSYPLRSSDPFVELREVRSGDVAFGDVFDIGGVSLGTM